MTAIRADIGEDQAYKQALLRGEIGLQRAFGFFYTIGSLCGIAAPLGYGLLGNHYGVETTVGVMGAAILLTLPLTLLLRRPLHQRARTPAPSAGA